MTGRGPRSEEGQEEKKLGGGGGGESEVWRPFKMGVALMMRVTIEPAATPQMASEGTHLVTFLLSTHTARRTREKEGRSQAGSARARQGFFRSSSRSPTMGEERVGVD
jgi:hypothetical protein